tara:strand:+ start:2489 stop:3250 length:762 start_codon:yes stop_codon:yes gene_type:complete
MAQPFALDRLASKVGLSQKRAQQDYFDARAREATNLLEKELQRIQKEASKETGLFGFKGGGLVKTALGMVNPALGLIAQGIDTATSQKDLKEMIKKAGMHKNIPAKFKGTFLDEYLTGGKMQGQTGLKKYLKGRKQADLMTGLASAALSGITAAKGTEWGKKIASSVGSTIQGTLPGSVLGNVFDPKSTRVLIPGQKLQKLLGPGLASKSALPLANLTTPALYAPMLEGLLQDYLLGEPEEPVMTRAQAPKFY